MDFWEDDVFGRFEPNEDDYDYEDEEFFESEEITEGIKTIKDAIRKSVKTEILEEMNRLKAENEKLGYVKEHLQEMEQSCEKKKSEFDKAIRDAKKMQIQELMEPFKVFLYTPYTKFAYIQKCNKCDTNRKVKIQLPSGNIVEDKCCCYKYRKIMSVSRKVRYEIDKSDTGVRVFYIPCKGSNDNYYIVDSIAKYIDVIFNHNKSFADIEALSESPYFATKEECREYCNYLNRDVPKEYCYDLEGNKIDLEAIVQF